MASPCVQVCELDDDGVCIGCLRTTGEIAAWPLMDGVARSDLLHELERRRAARAAPSDGETER